MYTYYLLQNPRSILGLSRGDDDDFNNVKFATLFFYQIALTESNEIPPKTFHIK
jgi:hypothetical protein